MYASMLIQSPSHVLFLFLFQVSFCPKVNLGLMPDSTRLQLSHCFVQMTAHTQTHTHMAIYILYSHSHTNQMQRVRKIQFTLTQTHPVQVLGVTAFKTGYIILLPLTM